MNFLSIKEWAELAQQDPQTWQQQLHETIANCRARTGDAVISWDLSSACQPGRGALGGVPYGAKELFDVEGWPSHSSSILPPVLEAKATKDAAVVERMRQLGASCAAKAQMNEFAYGLSGENPHYGNCPHPFLPGCLTGGSSSGSAYLVAAGYLPMALGTDTGGSIRLPASWCGLYGLRSVPGYCMDGAFPLAESFDTIGWFTRTSADMQQSIEAWFEVQTNDRSEPLKGGMLIPEALLDAPVFQKISSVVETLRIGPAAGSDVLENFLADCNVAFNVLQSREAYAIHHEWLELYGDLYDPAVKARILRGANWTDEQIEQAEGMRQRITDWFAAYFRSHDYLLMPVCPRPSVPVAQASGDLREKLLRLTAPASLAQKPVLTIPVTLEGKQSVGLQFIFNELDPSIPLRILELCENI